MKQQVILIGLVFAMLTAFSQTNSGTIPTPPKAIDPADTAKHCPHRIMVRFGTAYTNDIYNRFNKFDTDREMLKQNYAIGNVLEAGYAYFFHPKMGVGLGVGLSRISAKATLRTGGMVPVRDQNFLPDSQDGIYDMMFDCKDFGEKQAIWAIEVPLTFQFEHRIGKTKRNGIFASLGVKGYFPISARTYFPGGDIITSGYEEFTHALYENLPGRFGPAYMGGKFATSKMRPSVDIAADFGGLIGLTKRTDFYVGIYASYGFLDILPKEKVDYMHYTNGVVPVPEVNGMLNSNALELYNEQYDANVSTKWNLFQAGVKVGFHFKTCGQRKQSLREDKRDFYDKFEDRVKPAKQEDDAKKGKDGGKGETEPVHIIPIYMGFPPGSNAGNGNNGNNGNNFGDGTNNYQSPDDIRMDPEVKELIDALSNAQIYFDLDKDVPNNPRLAQREVEKAAAILKKSPNLKIILDGYTCKLGTQQHNEDLAQRRANTIRNMFIAKGVDPGQITTETFTVANYPAEIINTFQTLEDARTVIFKIVKR